MVFVSPSIDSSVDQVDEAEDVEDAMVVSIEDEVDDDGCWDVDVGSVAFLDGGVVVTVVEGVAVAVVW